MQNNLPTLKDANVKGKRVLLRAGFDVKIEDGVVREMERIKAILPTLNHLLSQGAAVILLAHQGRPKGKRLPEFTQRPVADALSQLLGKEVKFATDVVGESAQELASGLRPGEILLLENLRYEPGEEANDPAFAEQLAKLGDVYVNDAFTNAHRAHASMVGLLRLLPGYAGLQLAEEVAQLSRVTHDPARPLVLVVSGAKMETKVPVLERFLTLGDQILLGGCIANTFLKAQGADVGVSRYEPEAVPIAASLLARAATGGAQILLPTDAVAASNPKAPAVRHVPIAELAPELAILDIGQETVERYSQVLDKAASIVWNGPMGLYEEPPFAEGSKGIAAAIARATDRGAVTVVGGGDTIDFHGLYHVPLTAYTFVSTAGGAMLEFIGGAPMPALEALAR